MISERQPSSSLLTIKEVARYLRVDHTTVRRWIKSHDLEAVHLPRGGYRIKKETLDGVLNGPGD